MIACLDESFLARLQGAERIWWFLDYDGTLADFAPNPDVILPDPELIQLITKLASQDNMRVTIISGRRLAHIEQLLPITGIMKAGSYGLEMCLATGELKYPLAQQEIRPILDILKEQWADLLAGRSGFYLEDKGWTLAIHAKDADDQEGEWVIDQAKRIAEPVIGGAEQVIFKLSVGHRFLEVVPLSAGKQVTVATMIEAYPWPNAVLVYLGDDDKDAQAFAVVQKHGGVAVAVGDRPAVAAADCCLETPTECRKWLGSFLT